MTSSGRRNALGLTRRLLMDGAPSVEDKSSSSAQFEGRFEDSPFFSGSSPFHPLILRGLELESGL